jgi:hypothetical protein
MFPEFRYLNNDVKKLLKSCEEEGLPVDKEIVTIWISEIIDSLEKEDILKVSNYLMLHDRTLENLLKVYSFVNTRFEEIMQDRRERAGSL